MSLTTTLFTSTQGTSSPAILTTNTCMRCSQNILKSLIKVGWMKIYNGYIKIYVSIKPCIEYIMFFGLLENEMLLILLQKYVCCSWQSMPVTGQYIRAIMSMIRSPSVFPSTVQWKDFGLPDFNGEQSTIWLGSEGANTPGHQDSYGFNLVTQLVGK